MSKSDDVNIFYLHPSPLTAARWLHDKHLVKMVLESAQLLSTACQIIIMERDTKLYKPTHMYHPCTQWLLKSRYNAEWLYDHYIALCDQFMDKFRHNHKSRDLCNAIEGHIPLFPNEDFTEPPLCMPDDCKIDGQPAYQCYQLYYLRYKIRIGSYRRVKMPYWVSQALNVVADSDASQAAADAHLRALAELGPMYDDGQSQSEPDYPDTLGLTSLETQV